MDQDNKRTFLALLSAVGIDDPEERMVYIRDLLQNSPSVREAVQRMGERLLEELSLGEECIATRVGFTDEMLDKDPSDWNMSTEMREHLRKCPACRAEFGDLRAVRAEERHRNKLVELARLHMRQNAELEAITDPAARRAYVRDIILNDPTTTEEERQRLLKEDEEDTEK